MEKQEPIGIYVHIPFCVKKCNYCDFPSYAGLSDLFHDYTEALLREAAVISEKYGHPEVDTVFFGGGTPSILPSEEIAGIIDTLKNLFVIKEHSEITLEANPGTITEEKAKTWLKAGINRLSIGLQAAQDNLLKFMGRIHTTQMFLECINLLKDLGCCNINADIIFGLPGQSMDDWQETTGLLIKSGLPHISCYSLKIEEGTPWFELKKKGKLPDIDEDLEREMYYHVISEAKKAGYNHYEISNLSKPGYECRHNLKYWTDKPYIGVGAAAHSYIGNERYANVSDVNDYIDCVMKNVTPKTFSKMIDREEHLSERLILGLRKTDGLSVEELKQEFGHDMIEKYEAGIKMLMGKKLLSFDGDILKLTDKGLDFANLVWVEFI